MFNILHLGTDQVGYHRIGVPTFHRIERIVSEATGVTTHCQSRSNVST